MTIQERLDRGHNEDKIAIGEIVEKALSSEFGTVLKAIIEGLKSSAVRSSCTTRDLPSDVYLGRLQGYEDIVDKLDDAILDMQELKEDLRDDNRL